MVFYIYTILDPRKPGVYEYLGFEFDFEPFYIGKGHESRLSINRNRNNFCTNKINKIYNTLGEYPISKIVKNNLSEDKAFDLELKLIKAIGRCDKGNGPLTNLTDGGEGMIGYVMPDSVKAKIRKKRTGCRHSDETKRKISKIKKS